MLLFLSNQLCKHASVSINQKLISVIPKKKRWHAFQIFLYQRGRELSQLNIKYRILKTIQYALGNHLDLKNIYVTANLYQGLGRNYFQPRITLFCWQSAAVLFSHSKSTPVTSHPAVLFSHSKSTPVTSHNQPNQRRSKIFSIYNQMHCYSNNVLIKTQLAWTLFSLGHASCLNVILLINE